MKFRTAAVSLLGAALHGLLAARAQAEDATTMEPPLGISGSGTTNPSKCFWHVMSMFEEQMKLPAKLTYRAVGSGTGQKEFLGKGIDVGGTETDTQLPYNDFGAGDIPIAAVDRTAWFARGVEFVQLPFVLSAVSFFHNIPGVPSGGARGLNMTACLLSRVFGADIATWDHPDILAINPGLNVAEDFPIFVGRRVLGSSSTYSITHYLNAQCPPTIKEPEGWPYDKTASRIEWHPDTNPCDGSSAMTKCIVDNEGAIGYIDAAHGHAEGLNEIRLKNGDGKFLTSTEAGKAGVQSAAEDLSEVPASADGDFSKVAYYNEPGATTWPISLVSYVYIRKDLSFIKNPASRTLLKAFAAALFDPDYIGTCDRYGQIPVPSELKELALRGLDMVDAGDGPAWIFEKDTLPGIGQGDHVISVKRRSYASFDLERLGGDLSPLAEEVRQLKLEMATMQSRGLGAFSGAAPGATAARAAGLVAAVGAAFLGF